MKKKISIIKGDGIGPEIMEQTINILKTIEKKYNHDFIYYELIAGSKAIKEFQTPIPKVTIEYCLKSDAVLFGCVGDKKYDNLPSKMRPEYSLLKLRKKMKLYCNIRPIILFSKILKKSPIKKNYIKNVNFIIYRELTSGIYFGKKGRLNNGNKAYDYCIYSKKEIERITRMAFEASLSRKRKVTIIDKANVLETSRLWRETAIEISKYYPNIILDFLYIDNASVQIIVNPRKFDIILTDNMFGDILSDEASLISGSLGILPSASIGDKNAMFEPVHGSYPKAKGKNIANPIGCILSMGMMLKYFGLKKEEKLLKKAVKHSIDSGVCTEDINYIFSPNTTKEVGNFIRKYIKNY